MKNTEFNLNSFCGTVFSEDSLVDVLEMICDMDLEITEVRTAW